MFNQESNFFETKPKLLKAAVALEIAAFLRDGVISTNAAGVRIIFHGGEPLMIGARRLAELCEIFSAARGDVTQLGFSIQTNALLINDGWIELFSKWNMQVGVSLDGPPEINDRERVDHQGRGTYDRTVMGMRRVQGAVAAGELNSFGVLCVVDGRADGATIFDHFVGDLDLANIDFLIPMETWDSIDEDGVEAVGDYLVSAFNAWVAYNDPKVNVRIFREFIRWMTDRNALLGVKMEQRRNYLIMTIGSDGSFGPDDALRSALAEDLFAFDVKTHSLSDYLGHPGIRALQQAQSTPPADCDDCSWKRYCRGGSANGRVINRFSAQDGMARKSVMCAALRRLYSHMARWLVDSGMPREAMIARLEGRPAIRPRSQAEPLALA